MPEGNTGPLKPVPEQRHARGGLISPWAPREHGHPIDIESALIEHVPSTAETAKLWLSIVALTCGILIELALITFVIMVVAADRIPLL